jgi:uncharacterized protein YceK
MTSIKLVGAIVVGLLLIGCGATTERTVPTGGPVHVLPAGTAAARMRGDIQRLLST